MTAETAGDINDGRHAEVEASDREKKKEPLPGLFVLFRDGMDELSESRLYAPDGRWSTGVRPTAGSFSDGSAMMQASLPSPLLYMKCKYLVFQYLLDADCPLITVLRNAHALAGV